MIHMMPHKHIYNEWFGLELSARHSSSALRHINKATVQRVKVFLHKRRECTAAVVVDIPSPEGRSRVL